MRVVASAFGISLVLLAVGCSKGDAAPGTAATTPAAAPSAAPTASQAEPSAPASALVRPAQHVEIQIASLANTMAFDKTTLTFPAGAEVHLVFKNNATMTTLPHNWVLVKSGTEASVAAAGLKLGEPAGYLDIRVKDMLANTPMAKPGETSEVTFTAPAAGSYPYICTVPGHYMLMKGVATVTP